MTLVDLRPPGSETGAAADGDERAADGLARPATALHRQKSGRLIEVELTSQPLTWNGRPARMVMAVDVTARRQAEAEIQRLAYYDTLTQLPNRRLLADRLRQSIAAGARAGAHGAVLFVDIDDFKRVNDALGHQAGDGALRHLAALLQGKVRAGDTVARYGGEEFVILLPGMTDVQARELLVRAQRELTREVYLYESKQIFITFSAGTTRVDPQDSLESAIGRADDAMYQAKHAGKNCVAIA